jgi:hypothetical protein
VRRKKTGKRKTGEGHRARKREGTNKKSKERGGFVRRKRRQNRGR